MKSIVRVAAVLGVIALGVAFSSRPLVAREMPEIGGSALRVVTAITEPGALLVWGTVLAALARAISRRRSST